MKPKERYNFRDRFIMSLVAIVVVASLLLLSHTFPFNYLFTFALAAIIVMAIREFYQMARLKSINPLAPLGLAFAFLYIFLRFFATQMPNIRGFSTSLLMMSLTIIASLMHFRSTRNSIADISTTLFGVLYICLPMSLMIDLNFSHHLTSDSMGSVWVAFLLITTKITDTCAYFAGKKWGKELLAPKISPKKTVAGAIAGLLGAAATAVVFHFILIGRDGADFNQLTLAEFIILAVLISVLGQLGDLIESQFKRDAHVKDSSTLPGFGGVLDLIDSLIFTTPFLWVYLSCKDLI